MDSAKLNDWMQVVGIFALVASLVFVGLQMRQARDIAISEGNLANAAIKIERNNAIIENPDVWVRGSSGEDLDQNDETVFRNIVRNAFDVAFFEVVRMRRLGANDIADGLIADFSAFLFNNPGARRIWMEEEQDTQKYRTLLTTTEIVGHLNFAEAVKSNLAKLDQSQD